MYGHELGACITAKKGRIYFAAYPPQQTLAVHRHASKKPFAAQLHAVPKASVVAWSTFTHVLGHNPRLSHQLRRRWPREDHHSGKPQSELAILRRGMYAVSLRYGLLGEHSYAPVLAHGLQCKLPRRITPHVQSHRGIRRCSGEMCRVR